MALTIFLVIMYNRFKPHRFQWFPWYIQYDIVKDILNGLQKVLAVVRNSLKNY